MDVVILSCSPCVLSCSVLILLKSFDGFRGKICLRERTSFGSYWSCNLWILELKVQACCEYNWKFVRTDAPRLRVAVLTVPLDLQLCLLHLLEQLCISDDARCVPHFATCLIQPRNNSHYGAFSYVGKVSDLFKGLQSIGAGVSFNIRAHDISSRGARTIPFAHSYTTSASPNFSPRNSSPGILCASCTRSTRSAMARIASRPSSSFGGNAGSTSVFSWKTKHESRATTSSGSYAARVFSKMSSVSTSSFAELI